MKRRGLDDRGAVTAEFAVALPAVVIVLALAMGVLASATTAVRLQHAAAEAARLLGRGDEGRASSTIGGVGGRSDVERHDDMVCVAASAPVPVPLPFPPVHARACAWDGGR